MKILITHNAYQQRGGEDAVVNAETELLRKHGHDVTVYQRHNRDILEMSKIAAAASSVWSRRSIQEIGALCKNFQPDVIHSHNTFPLISPSLYWLAARQKIPVIQTLHNFRLLCPQAMFLRQGKVCEDCLGKLPWRAVTRSCYHASAVQSAVAAATITVHRTIGTYHDHVAAYIALSDFSRKKFIAGGLPAERIHLKPNFVEPGRMPDWRTRKGGLFVGRLSDEKGLEVLIGAAMRSRTMSSQAPDYPAIRIIGAGPLENIVRQAFGNGYLGRLSPADVFDTLHSTLFLVAPSTCYETFGLAAVEAFSCGVPVIASRHGGLGELIKDGSTGLLFEPGNPIDLAAKIAWANTHPVEMMAMGRAAYAEYLKKYTPEKNYHLLIDIYRNVISDERRKAYVA